MSARSAAGAGSLGSAVLVHGMWSSPADWQWIERLLREANVEVSIPDLPSHRPPFGTVADDVAEVREAIRASSGPVAVVGWSYGGKVVSMAAEGEAAIVRLLYVADIPAPPDDVEAVDTFWIDDDPHILVNADQSFVLDNDWWPEAEAERFSGEVLHHLRRSPRRPASWGAAADPQTAAAWRTIPTTVLIGRRDDLVPDDSRKWASQHLDDIRNLDADHFILMKQPEVVAGVVLEALSG